MNKKEILDNTQIQAPINKSEVQVNSKFFPPKNSIQRCFFTSKFFPPNLKKSITFFWKDVKKKTAARGKNRL